MLTVTMMAEIEQSKEKMALTLATNSRARLPPWGADGQHLPAPELRVHQTHTQTSPAHPEPSSQGADSLATGDFLKTQLMGSQITMWPNESEEQTFRELILHGFSQGPCAQIHTQRMSPPTKKIGESQESILRGRLTR